MLPILAIVISVLSLTISALVAWQTHFSPSKLAGGFSRITIWSFSSYIGKLPTGDVVSRIMTPYFWISNLGAKPALVEDIRIEFNLSADTYLYSFATSKVPQIAIESPSMYKDKASINHGGPFGGFCLNPKDIWQNCFAFTMPLENFEKLKGSIKTKIQYRLSGDVIWRDLIEEVMRFGSQPIHLQGLKHGGTASGASMNSVYSLTWMERKGQ